jgi:hypothetical protein
MLVSSSLPCAWHSSNAPSQATLIIHSDRAVRLKVDGPANMFARLSILLSGKPLFLPY